MQILSREHEYSQKDNGSISDKGRVRSHSKFGLSQLDCPDFVRNIISQGYCLPFSELPKLIQLRNNRSALLPFIVNDIVHYANACGMRHNPTKCKEMLLDFLHYRLPIQSPLSIGAHAVESVKSFKLLGVHFSRNLRDQSVFITWGGTEEFVIVHI